MVAEKSSVCRGSIDRQLRGDELDVRPEAHVEHPVGFVEHQHVEPGELRGAGAHVIHQPSRGRHDDVHTSLERGFLPVHGHAAEDGRAQQARVVAEALHVVLDLDGEFTRRREHEHPGRTESLRPRLLQ